MAVTSSVFPAHHIASDITQLVGHTPMLRLMRVAPEPAAGVFAKLEFLNPGGSIKDRAALGMILDAEARGLLHPGSTILKQRRATPAWASR
jgi:cysteine synthase